MGYETRSSDGIEDDMKRPMLHHSDVALDSAAYTVRDFPRNGGHLGVEGAKLAGLQGMGSRDASPTQQGFGQLDRALDELDATIGELRERLQSALGSDYPRKDSSETEPSPARGSDLVEALREHTSRVRSLRDVVATLNDRLEL